MRVATQTLLSEEDALWVPGFGDIYMVLDDGMAGYWRTLLKPFAGKDKVVKKIYIIEDQQSVDQRHERVRGIVNIKQMESLTSTQLTLPPKKYTHCPGGTGGDVLGPVVLQPVYPHGTQHGPTRS